MYSPHLANNYSLLKTFLLNIVKTNQLKHVKNSNFFSSYIFTIISINLEFIRYILFSAFYFTERNNKNKKYKCMLTSFKRRSN